MTTGSDCSAGVLDDVRAIVVMITHGRAIECPFLADALLAMPCVRPAYLEAMALTGRPHSMYFLDQDHPTALGGVLAAGVIADAIRASGWLRQD